jgi:hypothetical protein
MTRISLLDPIGSKESQGIDGAGLKMCHIIFSPWISLILPSNRFGIGGILPQKIGGWHAQFKNL